MEKARNEFQYTSFSDQELTLFTEDLKSILTTENLAVMTQEEAKNKRSESINHLAEALADRSISRDVVNLMINFQLDNDTNKLQVLYAYKSVIEKATANKTVAVPHNLLDFVAGIAEKQGEDSMAADIMQLRVPLEEIIGKQLVESSMDDGDDYQEDEEDDSKVLLIDGSTQKIAKGYKDELDLQADEEEEMLGALINETFDALNSSVGPEHAKDVKILEEHSYEPDDLYKDIATGRFSTNEGRNAAIAAQDMELIKQFGNVEDELFKYLQLGRFMTAEGQNAAILRQDFERLKSHSYDADELLQNLVLNRFISKEGIRAAEYRQDSERLAKHGESADELKKDLKLNNFLTPQGKIEAQNRIKELED